MDFWNRTLNEIRDQLGLKTEFELAVALGLHPAALGHLRSQARLPSPKTAIKILDRRGYTITKKVLAGILPKSAQKAIVRAERRRAIDIGIRILKDQPWLLSAATKHTKPTIDWIKALDELKAAVKPNSDAQLAKLIEINAPALSQVRAGTRSLTTAAKISILTELGIDLDEDALLAVIPQDLCDTLLCTVHKGLVRSSPNETDPGAELAALLHG